MENYDAHVIVKNVKVAGSVAAFDFQGSVTNNAGITGNGNTF